MQWGPASRFCGQITQEAGLARYDKRHRDTTRRHIIHVASSQFRESGIAAVGLAGIMAEAGLTNGAFYTHFASKEDLVLALREQFSRDLAERMRAAVEAVPASTLPASGGVGWADRLDACVRAGLERYRDLHDLHEVLFHHAHVPPPASGSVTPVTVTPDSGGSGSPDPAPAPAARVIRELLEAGVAAGAFDVPDPESTAVLCYASMHAFDHDFRGRPGPDDARLIRAAQQLFRRAAGLP